MTLLVCLCLQSGPATDRKGGMEGCTHDKSISRVLSFLVIIYAMPESCGERKPTVFAEASVIPGAVFDLRLWINVQKWTLLVATLAWEGVTQFEQSELIRQRAERITEK